MTPEKRLYCRSLSPLSPSPLSPSCFVCILFTIFSAWPSQFTDNRMKNSYTHNNYYDAVGKHIVMMKKSLYCLILKYHMILMKVLLIKRVLKNIVRDKNVYRTKKYLFFSEQLQTSLCELRNTNTTLKHKTGRCFLILCRTAIQKLCYVKEFPPKYVT